MSHRIVLTLEAEAQLDQLYEYLARESSIDIATRYVDAIVERAGRLSDFPHRGTPRDDIRPGMRTISFRRRVTIAYVVARDEVRIAGIFYAGQDFERLMLEE